MRCGREEMADNDPPSASAGPPAYFVFLLTMYTIAPPTTRLR